MAGSNELKSSGNTTYVDGQGERKKGVTEKSDDSSLSYWQQLETYYDGIYRGAVEENNAYAAAATERTLAEIRSRIDALNQEYGRSNRQLYLDYMGSKKNLPQQLSAAGYTGGLSESSLVRLDTDYQNNLAESERSRLAGASELNARGAQAEQENLSAARKANADAQREYYGSLAALRGEQHREEREDARLREERERQEAAAQRERSWALEDAARNRAWMESDALRDRAWSVSDAEQRQQRADALARAELLASAGDFSGYEALGYSRQEIERLRLAWESANAETALGMDARAGAYSAGDVAALPAAQAQRYLNALGYLLDVNGSWDYATEAAYREVFGRGSGRFSAGGGYGYAEAQDQSSLRLRGRKGIREAYQSGVARNIGLGGT